MKLHSSTISSASAVKSAAARVAAYDWHALASELDNHGCAVLQKLLLPEECRGIAALYPDESNFRSQIFMARYGFGSGEYRYFKYPFRNSSMAYARRSIPTSQVSPTSGTAGWESTTAIPTTTPRSSSDAMTPAKRVQRRFSYSMFLETSIASTRISTAISYSPSRSRFSYRSPARTSEVVSSS